MTDSGGYKWSKKMQISKIFGESEKRVPKATRGKKRRPRKKGLRGITAFDDPERFAHARDRCIDILAGKNSDFAASILSQMEYEGFISTRQLEVLERMWRGD